MTNAKNWNLKLISVLMAILLWLFITNENVIIRQQGISGVKLNAINISTGLTAAYPEEVRVSIVGTPRTAREINAYVDLKGKGSGVYDVPVKIRPIAGTRVSSITPAEVRVEITEIQEFIFPVSYRIDQPPPEGYKVSAVEVKPAKCVISGGQKQANQVSSLTTLLDLSSLQDTAALKTKVIALDNAGNPVGGVQIMPPQVQAYVVIEKSQAFGKAVVNPFLIGTPPEGYEVGKMVVEPREITLIGSEEALAEVKSINTKPIDLTGYDKPFQQEVELESISGVSVFPSRVTVMVEIVGSLD